MEPAPSVSRAALFITLAYFERDRVSSCPSTRRLFVTPNAPGVGVSLNPGDILICFARDHAFQRDFPLFTIM